MNQVIASPVYHIEFVLVLNFCFCFVHTQTEIGIPDVATPPPRAKLSFLSQRVTCNLRLS
jgi:hypothetical protein